MSEDREIIEKIVRLEAGKVQIQHEVDKLDANLMKLTEIAGDVKELLAVHDNRLDSQDKMIETLMSKHDKDLDIVHERIDRTNTKVDDEGEKILAALASHRTQSASDNKEILGKIAQLQKFYWMAVGALTVLTFIIPIILKYWVNII